MNEWITNESESEGEEDSEQVNECVTNKSESE
jgi:hypothetical protein